MNMYRYEYEHHISLKPLFFAFHLIFLNIHIKSVAQNKPDFTAGDVEYSFDGNICRCTGYRPIIEGFKSLIKKPPEELLKQKCPSQDIEVITSTIVAKYRIALFFKV